MARRTRLITALGAAILSIACTRTPIPSVYPAPPLDRQDVTVEHGDRLGSTLSLCDSPEAFVPFDRAAERQVYDVLRSYRTGLDDTLERLTAKTVVAESDRYGLDPWLVVGVIRVESRFYDFSESNKGALGLMQLLPDSGEELSQDLGVEWVGPATLYNPVKNVKLGTAYLAILQHRFHGDLPQTLAAYNMGPARVRAWMRDGRDLPTGYADLVREYRKKLRRIAFAEPAGADLRDPITMLERAVALEHTPSIVPIAGLESDVVVSAVPEPPIQLKDDGAASAEPAISPAPAPADAIAVSTPAPDSPEPAIPAAAAPEPEPKQ